MDVTYITMIFRRISVPEEGSWSCQCKFESCIFSLWDL